jgi:putative membrane protein
MIAPVAESSVDQSELQAAATQRLHPLSWLFILISQLKSFALPLIVLVFSGRGERDVGDLIGLVAGGGLAVTAVWQYFTYRYGFLDHALVIRSGILQRNLRLIPFDRVQNVTLHQSLLHRLVGVAEVKLESAGGMGNAEAQMRVLRLAQAHELEALLRSAPNHESSAENEETAASESRVWLQLPTSEIIRLGLISNRGMIVVAAGFAYLSQSGGGAIKWLSNAAEDAFKSGAAVAEQWHFGLVAYIVGSIVLLLALLIAMRLLSIALALLQFHGFTLTAGERELRVERGLLSRIRSHLPKRRIQAFSLSETLLHRWFSRQSLRVDRAAMEAVNESQSISDLVPIATPGTMDSILRDLLPRQHWPLQQWHALHPRAWWRQFAIYALMALVLSAGLIVWRGPAGAWALLLVPMLYVRARLWARYSAWSLEGGVIAFRQGWLNRHWRFAEARKLQTLRLSQSPFDRRHGMATLHMDTIGASPFEPELCIPYLHTADAGRLAAQLRALMPYDEGRINRARTAASAAPEA